MAVRKRNEFLDGADSEEEYDNGYDSAEEEESRAKVTSHTNKRRKVDSDSEASFASFDDDEDDREAIEPVAEAIPASKDSRFSLDKFDSPTTSSLPPSTTHPTNHDRQTQSAALKQVAAAAKAQRKSGVIYISRVPPFMKPTTLKHFLAPYASKGLGRVFLTPEDHATHTRRVKNGGNKKKSFSDGWVEFTSKTEAKAAAERLNGNIIGGKKGGFYHDDLWNMKYLSGFKWNHLTEQIANENAERAARVREDVRVTRRENRAFVEDVERAKVLGGMESKRKAKGGKDGGGMVRDGGKAEREFKQRAPQLRQGEKAKAPSADAGRVLSKIF